MIRRFAEIGDCKSYATFSDCGLYRYTLGRVFGAGPYVCFVMLNPSKADESRSDPTVTRCMNYALSWGFKSMRVVNLFPWISTDPLDLGRAKKAGHDITGGLYGDAELSSVKNADLIIAAWGCHKLADARAKRFLQLTDPREIHCLRLAQRGQPYHPLYQRADLKPIPFARCK